MTVQLKGGYTTEDKRLDLIPFKDERSRLYKSVDVIETPQLVYRDWFPGVWMDQLAEGACFPPGTLIRMADGTHKPIEEIKTLDRVVTAEANVGFVMQTMVRRYVDDIVHLKLRGNNVLKCTKEHPILTKDGYKAAEDLTPQDYVAIPRYSAEVADKIYLHDIVGNVKMRGKTEGTVRSGGVESEIAPIPEYISLDADFGRLLGLYAAEGATTPNKVVWSFGGHEEETLVAETVKLAEKTLGAKARLQYRPNNSINVVVYGKIWKTLFERIVPGTARNGDKRLSSWVTRGSDAYLESLFYGWLDGDGHRRRSRYTGISVCKQLALDMFAIAQYLGLRPAINVSKPVTNKHAKTRQNRWSVSVSDGGGTNTSEMTETHVWRKVQNLRFEPYDGWVYNFHVHGDESYIAEGVGVHNCVAFALCQELASSPIRYTEGIDDAYAFEMYHTVQHRDPWPGCSLGPRCPIQPSPHTYEGTSLLAGLQELKDRGKLKEYRWAFGEEDLALSVGHLGPAVIGVAWYESMYHPHPRTNYIVPAGRKVGGHAILVAGFDPYKQRYKLWNSWGKDYGINGWAYLSRSDMQRLLSENGEAAIPIKRVENTC